MKFLGQPHLTFWQFEHCPYELVSEVDKWHCSDGLLEAVGYKLNTTD